MINLQRRSSNEEDANMISNQLFVSLVKYGKVVQSLYNSQLKQKYASIYKQFMQLDKQLRSKNEKN